MKATCPYASSILFVIPVQTPLPAKIKLRFGLASVGYGGHSSLGTQSAKLTADSIGDNEIAGKKAWVC